MSLPDDLDVAKEAAAQVMDPRKVNAFLCKQHEELGGVTPIFLIRGGKLDEVLAFIRSIGEGVTA